MCGIAGFVRPGENNSRKWIESMLESIHYRGPDERGIYHSSELTMGSVRLSIIDLEGGSQPISDQTGRYWIVFNGEIYNYPELKKGLEGEGFKFKTSSDTEVLVQLFARDKEKALQKINGQFVFAIWDKLEKQLFVARDRVGIRPLFYHIDDSGRISFASEIKSLFQLPFIQREFDFSGLKEVFTCWAPISPGTVYRGINELSPGHYIYYKDGKLKINKYWDLDFSNMGNDVSLNQAVEEFSSLLNNATKIRLRADVEVAAYLSGGIDSSATVSYIKNIEPGILNTFSIGFEDSEFDESVYQIEVSEFLQTKHASIKCSSEDIALNFERAVHHAELPVLRTAPVPMMILSKLVRDHKIKVVITGEGADEFLGGYNIFKENEIRNFWSKYPDSRIRPLLLKKLYPYIPYIAGARPEHLKFFFGYKLTENQDPFYSHILRWKNTSSILKYLNADVSSEIGSYDVTEKISASLPADFNSWSGLSRAQWLESKLFMSGYLLSSQGDRMGMANSVEGRYPFLDHNVIEFLAKLPSGFKLNGLNEKYLLKRLVRDKLPPNVVNRPKQAYRAPIAYSLTHPSLQSFLTETSVKQAGVFDSAKVQILLSKFKAGKNISETDNMALAAILSTQMLFNHFIEGNPFDTGNNKMKVKTKIINDEH